MPLRSLVAGFLMTMNFANPGTKKGAGVLEFFVAYLCKGLYDALDTPYFFYCLGAASSSSELASNFHITLAMFSPPNCRATCDSLARSFLWAVGPRQLCAVLLPASRRKHRSKKFIEDKDSNDDPFNMSRLIFAQDGALRGMSDDAV